MIENAKIALVAIAHESKDGFEREARRPADMRPMRALKHRSE
jgi:hypothetical protein